MKKILLITILLGALFTVTAQKDYKYKPYVGVGTTLSSNQMYYGAEVGVYNDKAWFSVGATTWAQTQRDKFHWTGSFKSYYKIASQGIVDEFAWAAVNVTLDRDKAISFEPGAAIVFNIWDKFAPQVSFSLPIAENSTSVWRPLNMNFGISLNYWIK